MQRQNRVESGSGRLQTVYGAMEFRDRSTSGTEYYYDGNDSLVADANKGIAMIEYDNLNYPRRIQFTNGNTIEYVYSPDGRKLRAKWQTAAGNVLVPLNTTQSITASSTTQTDYVGDLIYTGTDATADNPELSKILYPDGYFMRTSDTSGVFRYFVKDHLGNNRVVNNGTAVYQRTHYYPFGGPYADVGTASDYQPYKYNGKELDRMHGLDLYDYGERQYDPIVPMFTQQDPLAEKYYHLSPYVYCANNPVKYIDKDGKGPLLGAIIGGLVDYAAQVTINAIEKRELSIESFTQNIDLGSIATSMLEGAATSGASSLKAAASIAKVTTTIVNVGTDNAGELDISVKSSDEVLVGAISDRVGKSAERVLNEIPSLPTKKAFTTKQKVKVELRSKGEYGGSINQKARRIANLRNAKTEVFNRTTGKVNAKINRVGAETHNYVGKATTSWLNREYENQ